MSLVAAPGAALRTGLLDGVQPTAYISPCWVSRRYGRFLLLTENNALELVAGEASRRAARNCVPEESVPRCYVSPGPLRNGIIDRSSSVRVRGDPDSGYRDLATRIPVRGDDRALRSDVLYGFFVITLPAGVITYQRPPFRFFACPDAVPGAESPM
jgi:hypothetical protein